MQQIYVKIFQNYEDKSFKMEEIYRLIHDIYVFLDGGDTFVLSKFDLNQTQYRTLMLLDTDEGKSQTVLSDELFRNRSTITRLIDQLEKRGLVSREQKPMDRRTLYITLTETGKALCEEVHKEHVSSLLERFSCFSDTDITQFKRLLHLLRDSLIANLEEQNQNKGGIIETP